MRRIMKKVEFSKSSPVLFPPPLFVTALRRKLSKLYRNSHGLKPSMLNYVLAPLFHPDYIYNYSLDSPIESMVMLDKHIHDDPVYVAERVAACVEAFTRLGVPEMTFDLLIKILDQVNNIMKSLVVKANGEVIRYHRKLADRWEFIAVPKSLNDNRHRIVRNEPHTPRRVRWQVLTTSELEVIADALNVPMAVLLCPLRYVSVRGDAYSIESVLKEIDWRCLLEPQ